MSTYTFRNTEQTKGKGSDYETFSLLFLLAYHSASDRIDIVLVDTFNDTTGCDEGVVNLWDVQSKGHKDPNPKKIGNFLFTLWENFCSKYPFMDYILLVEKINPEYLLDNSLDYFGFNNFKKNTGIRIRNGLESEIRRRAGLKDTDSIDTASVNKFLQVVKLKIWNFSKAESLKSMTPFSNGLILDDSFYSRIFDEVRDKQSALKNICVEGLTIHEPFEVLNFKKQISKIEIVTLLVNRVIGADLFSQMNTPNHFVQFLHTKNPEDIKDIIFDCNAALARTWFNKNNKRVTWELIEATILAITKHPGMSVNDYIAMIPKNLILAVGTLNELHLRFFISRVLEGIK